MLRCMTGSIPTALPKLYLQLSDMPGPWPARSEGRNYLPRQKCPANSYDIRKTALTGGRESGKVQKERYLKPD